MKMVFIRLTVVALLSFFVAAPVVAQELGAQILAWDKTPCRNCPYLAPETYESVLSLLFQHRVGSLEFRREPSFGYPTQVVVFMGSRPRAVSYEVVNPIVLPNRKVSLLEHLSVLAWKFSTTKPEELAKHIVVKQTPLNVAAFEPYMKQVEALPLAPKFNRTDAFEVVGDGTEYSITIDDHISQLSFRSNSACSRTASQQTLYEVLTEIWRHAFPGVRFDSAE